MASISGLSESFDGSTLGTAFKAAIARLGGRLDKTLRVKVAERVTFDAQELLGLLREMDMAQEFGQGIHWAAPTELLDLSQCALHQIDLDPGSLAQLSSEAELSTAGGPTIKLDRAVLRGTQLVSAKLRRATMWYTDLAGADLSVADLRDAALGFANLTDASLSGCRLDGALLVGSHLERADLSGASLRECDVDGARFQEADLSLSDLRDLDLRPVGTLHHVRWHDARLGPTWLYRHQIEPIQDEVDAVTGQQRGSYRYAMEAFLALKTNFAALGMYDSAGWAFVKEQQMRKALYFPTTAGKQWIVSTLAEVPPNRWWSASLKSIRYRARSAVLHARLFLGLVPNEVNEAMRVPGEQADRPGWFRSWIFELLAGYGERPWNVVVGGAVTILAFALPYWLTGALQTDGRPRWFTSWSFRDIDWSGMVDAFVYSVATFATFNLGRSGLNPEGRGIELASSIEALLGIGVLALFVFTLGNRMRGS